MQHRGCALVACKGVEAAQKAAAGLHQASFRGAHALFTAPTSKIPPHWDETLYGAPIQAHMRIQCRGSGAQRSRGPMLVRPCGPGHPPLSTSQLHVLAGPTSTFTPCAVVDQPHTRRPIPCLHAPLSLSSCTCCVQAKSQSSNQRARSVAARLACPAVPGLTPPATHSSCTSAPAGQRS